jgi:uncharacterized Zn-binding protein involved in type VI secretion
MFPAARIGDTATHDSVTPTGLIAPPVVPPPPTAGKVFIEGMPAAYVTCTVVCSGATSVGMAHPPPGVGVPPVPIVLGTPTVFINGKPAARWMVSGDATACGAFLGDPKLTATRTVRIGMGAGARTGVGMDTDIIVSLSATLSAAINELQALNWKMVFGKKDGGSSANRNTRVITIDSAKQNDPHALAQTIAHEIGHAKHNLAPPIPPSGLTRDEYIQQNTYRHLDDEGAANFMNAKARDEIRQNSKGREDIGIAGAQKDEYQQIYDEHQAGEVDEEGAKAEMGELFGDGEKTSNTHETYNTYYGKPYANSWDANCKNVTPGGTAP